MFDLAETLKAAGQSAVLVEPTVYGVTTVAGNWLHGKAQLAFGIILGLVLGICAQIAQVGVPVDFPGWFSLVIFGIAAGLVPAAVYEANKKAAEKGSAAQPVELISSGEVEGLGKSGQDLGK